MRHKTKCEFMYDDKCSEDCEVRLHTHLVHLFIIAQILFYLDKLIQKTLAEPLKLPICQRIFTFNSTKSKDPYQNY